MYAIHLTDKQATKEAINKGKLSYIAAMLRHCRIVGIKPYLHSFLIAQTPLTGRLSKQGSLLKSLAVK